MVVLCLISVCVVVVMVVLLILSEVVLVSVVSIVLLVLVNVGVLWDVICMLRVLEGWLCIEVVVGGRFVVGVLWFVCMSISCVVLV